MKLNKDTIQEIKNNISIKEIVSQYTDIKNNKGICPIHSDNDPSFYIYPDTNTYYCFGCQSGGDIIQFIEEVEGINFIDAVKKITGEKEFEFDNNYDDFTSNDLMEIIEQLKDIKPKKFNDEKWINQYANNNHNYFIKQGFKRETLRYFKVGFCWDGSELHNRVTIPWYTHDGLLIGVSGRDITGKSKAKYICRKGSNKSDYFYNLNNAKEYADNGIIVVESEKDVWKLWEWEYNNVVALGNSALGDRGFLLRKYTDKAILCLDNDLPGEKATKKIIKQLKPLMIVKHLQLPVDIKDITDRKDGEFKLKKKVFDNLISNNT